MSLIGELWACEDEAVWRFALKTYWLFVKRKNQDLEKEIERLEPEVVQRLDPKGWDDFLFNKYFPWKYTAANRLVTTRNKLQKHRESENGLAEIYDIKERLFALDPAKPENIEVGLTIAKGIGGLGTAGASGLLAVLFPEHFGTVDRFAVEAVQAIDGPHKDLVRGMKPEGFTPREAAVVVQMMREKASDNNRKFGTTFWTPRKIDMILWTYGREEVNEP